LAKAHGKEPYFELDISLEQLDAEVCASRAVQADVERLKAPAYAVVRHHRRLRRRLECVQGDDVSR
jgi:hypothetical protein